MLRYSALVEATERLLLHHSPDDVGLYQIAEEANVPPASVYHFFPTKEAAFLALAQSYLEDFIRLGDEPIPATALHSWQDLLKIDQDLARNYYNAHPPAMKILYGGYGGVETRQVDSLFNLRIAETLSVRLDTVFHMPFVREAARKFENCIAILDGIWSISYRRYGEITYEYSQEALAACSAYCRLYLPEKVEVRDVYLEAAARGEMVILPRNPAAESSIENRRSSSGHKRHSKGKE